MKLFISHFMCMTKKNYILTLLNKLDGTREMAGPLQMLIEHTDVDTEFVD